MDHVGFIDKQVCSRKTHHCEWCPEPILPGSDARYREYLFDGRWVHGWMHIECGDALDGSSLDDNGFMPHEHERGVPEE